MIVFLFGTQKLFLLTVCPEFIRKFYYMYYFKVLEMGSYFSYFSYVGPQIVFFNWRVIFNSVLHIHVKVPLYTCMHTYSQVVFNCIDYGEYFDYAVTSLCVSLSLPYVSASSYGHSAVAECYPAVEYPQKGPCWGCNNAPAKTEILERITPDKILNLKSLEFLPKVSELSS